MCCCEYDDAALLMIANFYTVSPWRSHGEREVHQHKSTKKTQQLGSIVLSHLKVAVSFRFVSGFVPMDLSLTV